MAEEILNRHPILEMLDANEPVAVEYWLTDDGLARIYEDFENGRINGPTYQHRIQAWVAAWRKRLEDWQSTRPADSDTHLLQARVWVKPGVPGADDNDIPQHLQPQKVRAKPCGPQR